MLQTLGFLWFGVCLSTLLGWLFVTYPASRGVLGLLLVVTFVVWLVALLLDEAIAQFMRTSLDLYSTVTVMSLTSVLFGVGVGVWMALS